MTSRGLDMPSEPSSSPARARTAIITRTKDRTLLLRRAIESVLSQSDGDWIHVVVNDGGEEAPVRALLDSYRSQYRGRLLFLHSDNSRGMEAASNSGIAASQSEFLLIHDDDDSLQPDFLEKTVGYLLHPPARSVKGVACLATLVEERLDGDRIVVERQKLFRALGSCVLASEVAVSNPIPPISFLFRRSALDQIGTFDEELPVLGDWDFLLRFVARFDIGVIPEPLANYHVRPRGLGNSANSVIGDMARHQFYENVVRNRVMRHGNAALAILAQQGAVAEPARRKLEIIYGHPVLGRVIRAWSKFVNSRVPPSP